MISEIRYKTPLSDIKEFVKELAFLQLVLFLKAENAVYQTLSIKIILEDIFFTRGGWLCFVKIFCINLEKKGTNLRNFFQQLEKIVNWTIVDNLHVIVIEYLDEVFFKDHPFLFVKDVGFIHVYRLYVISPLFCEVRSWALGNFEKCGILNTVIW